ncbi:hypothetical protein K7X08_004330 [Anisodus acutangulus]|uniref:Uncharacterized protein n=1 Tax=Anisodus acutangulus TaxID=402998 RepID=A0A9Q1MH34_9SOLA|nr:hypothetical protein K7X08_004330 [Anisodus acutangulus]
MYTVIIVHHKEVMTISGTGFYGINDPNHTGYDLVLLWYITEVWCLSFDPTYMENDLDNADFNSTGSHTTWELLKLDAGSGIVQYNRKYNATSLDFRLLFH